MCVYISDLSNKRHTYRMFIAMLCLGTLRKQDEEILLDRLLHAGFEEQCWWGVGGGRCRPSFSDSRRGAGVARSASCLAPGRLGFTGMV